MLAYLKSSSRPPGMSGALLVSYADGAADGKIGVGHWLLAFFSLPRRLPLLPAPAAVVREKGCCWLLQAVLGTIQLYHAKVGE